MGLIRNIDNMINDKKYRINIIDNKINIINYTEIKEFSDTKIIILSNNSNTIINGKSLVISKMMNQELLITGIIKSIELR